MVDESKIIKSEPIPLWKAELWNRKADIFIREAVLLMACVVVFPLKSIRVLAFKWHLWIQKWEKEIQKNHEEYFKL